MKRMRWAPAAVAALLVVVCCCASTASATGNSGTVDAAVVAEVPPSVVDTGSTAWMLMSGALVLFMIPGLALFYGGMVRARNVLNMFMCVMVAIGVIGLHWAILGYALAFGARSLISVPNPMGEIPWSLLGWDSGLLFLRSFTAADFGRFLASGDTSGSIATHVPELAFAMFQGKFAIITPALIVGAVAERVRFGPLILFMLLWSTLVYCPVAHWVWNVNGWLFQYGVLDFAGGTVVHVLAGVSGLALILVIGPRTGYRQVAMPPHSLGLTLIGAGLLWFGWFGFNAGSAIAVPAADQPVAGRVAALAFANTQLAAAAAATAWMLVEWLHHKRPTILGFASGMVAGLVVITPCAGHVLPWHSMVIGTIGGAACYFGCRLKNVFGLDDSLDAFGVHGIGGAVGALLVGLFAFRPVQGGWEQFTKQLIGVSVAALFAFVMSYAIGVALNRLIGLRATPRQERVGLDLSVHGESGYVLTSDSSPLPAAIDEGHPDARGSAPALAR